MARQQSYVGTNKTILKATSHRTGGQLTNRGEVEPSVMFHADYVKTGRSEAEEPPVELKQYSSFLKDVMPPKNPKSAQQIKATYARFRDEGYYGKKTTQSHQVSTSGLDDEQAD